MRLSKLKIIGLFIFSVYILSIGISFMFLHKSNQVHIGLSSEQEECHKKSHRRPAKLRIGHPLFESCLQDENYEKLLVKPFHTLGNIHIYSAFLDRRTVVPYVRMIAMINFRNQQNSLELWCHFGGKSSKHVTTKAVFYEMCENHHFSHGGWIISCPISSKHFTRLPCEFYIKETSALYDLNPSVMLPLLKISDVKEEPIQKSQAKFGLCVPPLYGSIEPSEFIKFMSFVNTLGINHITLYVYNVTNKLNSVLNYLEDRGLISVIPWVLPTESNHIWYYGHSVAINDCLYRSMSYFDYLAFTDLDEYIVPHRPSTSLPALLDLYKSKNKKIAAFSFKGAFFIQNPEAVGNGTKLDILDNIYRTEEVSKIRSKVIVDPYKIFEVGIHHVSRTWPDYMNYVTLEMDSQDAIVHHYRSCIPTRDLSCSSFITDSTVIDWHQYYITTRYNARMKELQSLLNAEI